MLSYPGLRIALVASALASVASSGAWAQEKLNREFKMPLRTEPFTAQPDAAGSVYVRRMTDIIRNVHSIDVLPISKPDKIRTVQFLDTFGTCRVRSAGFILRLREDDKGRKQLTLKTRSPDADWVRKTEFAAASSAKGKSKIEEDILPPNKSQLSRSVSVVLPEGEVAPTLVEGLSKIFPIIGTLIASNDFVGPVENMKAKERAYGMPKWQVNGVTFEAEVALWLNDAGKVLFAEASFRYTVPEGEAEAQAAAAAADKLFAAMQADRTGRVSSR